MSPLTESSLHLPVPCWALGTWKDTYSGHLERLSSASNEVNTICCGFTSREAGVARCCSFLTLQLKHAPPHTAHPPSGCKPCWRLLSHWLPLDPVHVWDCAHWRQMEHVGSWTIRKISRTCCLFCSSKYEIQGLQRNGAEEDTGQEVWNEGEVLVGFLANASRWLALCFPEKAELTLSNGQSLVVSKCASGVSVSDLI